MRLERRRPRLQRRGFRGVKPRRFDIARPFSCFALMQAGTPAFQSHPPCTCVPIVSAFRDNQTNLSQTFTKSHNLFILTTSLLRTALVKIVG